MKLNNVSVSYEKIENFHSAIHDTRLTELERQRLPQLARSLKSPRTGAIQVVVPSRMVDDCQGRGGFPAQHFQDIHIHVNIISPNITYICSD